MKIILTEILERVREDFEKSFVDEYIMIVDQKLYIAKDSGRNKIEVC